MIFATIYIDESNIIHGFSLKGHANYSASGSDIVCSAVSLLVINTINSIECFTNEQSIVETDEEKGIVTCKLPNRADGIVDAQVDLLIKSMMLGLESLEEQYGKYIKLTQEAQK